MMIMSGALKLLQAGISRRQASAADPQKSASEVEELMKDAGAMMELVEAIKQGEVQTQSSWDLAMTWIVARKAVYVGKHEAWMSTRYAI